MTLMSYAKFEEKLTLGSKNKHQESGGFWYKQWQVQNLHFDFLHLFSAKKVQKSYLSWHWRVIQTLKKNGLFVWKRIWRTWWILTWVLESLKICTLMGYFCRKYVMFELKQGVQYILILQTPDILLTFWTHNLTYGTKKSHKALHAMDPVD